MRPEMTNRSIERAQSWAGLTSLTVIIDGLRKNASVSETQWREETIRVAERHALENTKIDLWVYQDNIGNTNHVIRTQERALGKTEYPIWLEEDIDLDFDKYQKLRTETITNDGRPFLLTGYSHGSHNLPNSWRNTLFVPLWGLTVNSELVELTHKTWRDQKFDARIVRHALDSALLGSENIKPNYFEKVLSYWTDYSEWAIRSSRRWDALANYSLWSVGEYSTAATERIAHDSSYLDFRGMNQRSAPVPANMHQPTFRDSGRHSFCLRCEILGSRIEQSIYKRVSNALIYRASAGLTRTGLKNNSSQWYSN
jgi:hypothetical protein